MKKIVIFSTIFVLLMGCNIVPKSFEQGLQLIDKAAEVAEKQGTAYNATIRWDGKVGGSWIQRAELDSGVTVEVTFHGNAAAERPSVSAKDTD